MRQRRHRPVGAGRAAASGPARARGRERDGLRRPSAGRRLRTAPYHHPAGQAGAINHFAINCTDIDGAYKLAQEKGYKVVSEGIEALPFWEKGIRFFIIEGPTKERVEIDQIL